MMFASAAIAGVFHVVKAAGGINSELFQGITQCIFATLFLSGFFLLGVLLWRHL